MSKIFLPKAFKSEKNPLSKAFFSLGNWIQGQVSSGELNISGLPTTVQGDILYASGTDTIVKLTKSTSATRYLSNTGTSNNPAWAQVNLANGVTGTLPSTNLPTNLQTYNGLKRYVALLTQTGTNAPTATVLENTTGTTMTWSYAAQGNYQVTAGTAIFVGNKTVITPGAFAYGMLINANKSTNSVITVRSTNLAGSANDDLLNGNPITIEIYP